MNIFKKYKLEKYNQEEWYISLTDEGKYIADLIFKYHKYYRRKDKKFKIFVYLFKTAVLFLAMCSTIILGIKFCTGNYYQVNLGLILSAIITFLTALTSFFNFEQYWMRNILMHIELNRLRDNFIYEVKTKQMNDQQLMKYMEKLDNIQSKNINYWENAILKIK